MPPYTHLAPRGAGLLAHLSLGLALVSGCSDLSAPDVGPARFVHIDEAPPPLPSDFELYAEGNARAGETFQLHVRDAPPNTWILLMAGKRARADAGCQTSLAPLCVDLINPRPVDTVRSGCGHATMLLRHAYSPSAVRAGDAQARASVDQSGERALSRPRGRLCPLQRAARPDGARNAGARAEWLTRKAA